MGKKAKTVLALIKKFTVSFQKLNLLLAKHTKKNAAKRTLLLTRYCLVLIKVVNFSLYYDVMISMVCYEILFSFITLIGSRYFEQKEA